MSGKHGKSVAGIRYIDKLYIISIVSKQAWIIQFTDALIESADRFAIGNHQSICQRKPPVSG